MEGADMQWETEKKGREGNALAANQSKKLELLSVVEFEELAKSTLVVEEEGLLVEYEVNLFRFPVRESYMKVSPEVSQEEAVEAISAIDPKNPWQAGNNAHLAACIEKFEGKGLVFENYIVAIGGLSLFDRVPTSYLNSKKKSVIAESFGKSFFANTTSFLVVRKKTTSE